MDRRHLRGKNFVSRIAHFLGEDGPRFNVSGLDLLGFFARGNRSRVLMHRGVDRSRGHGSSLRNRRFQGTQADLRGTQVRYFVDLEDRVHVAASLKDFLDLVGGDRVNAAAEGVELDHLKVRLIAHASGGLVQARMVGHWSRTRRGRSRRWSMMESSVRTAIPRPMMTSGIPWLISGSRW